MNIQNVSNINFTSRQKTIRFADDIARHVNKCYPRISSTLIDDFENASAYRDFRKSLYKRFEKELRTDISDRFDDSESLIGRILAITKPIKESRLGNCGESAMLAEIVAKINGVKNCYIASLMTSEGKNLDHSVLYVQGEKPYVIDAWLGFADFVPRAIQRFRSEYSKHFNAENGDKFVFQKLDNDYAECLNQDFSRRQINKLRKIYPDHVIKRGYV